MQVSRQTLRDEVGISQGFFVTTSFHVGLWFYCNNYTDNFNCISY